MPAPNINPVRAWVDRLLPKDATEDDRVVAEHNLRVFVMALYSLHKEKQRAQRAPNSSAGVTEHGSSC